MNLGTPSEWGMAGQVFTRGVDEVGNLVRGGTIQEIKTKQVKAFAKAVMGLMGQSDMKPTPQDLFTLAEQFELDPYEASGVLDVIMGFQDKMRGQGEREQLMNSLSPQEQKAALLKKQFGYTQERAEDPNIALKRALEVQDKLYNINQRPQKEATAKEKRDIEQERLGMDRTRFKERNLYRADKNEISEPEAQKELARMEMAKQKISTTGGMDQMAFAFIAQSNPELADKIKGQDASKAIKAIDEYQDYLRGFITAKSPPMVLPNWKDLDTRRKQ
uniref:Uncharacterized protein n=1 Tax=viral metagenome TaxID=1070528 RepID=A0A6H1ZF95_9ZZZZ